MYKEIERCRICGNSELVEVLDLGTQTLTGVFPRTRDQAITAGPLRLVKCMGSQDVCGLLQLQHTYDLSELYGDNYGYRSGLNPAMVTHLQAKVRRILGGITLPNDALIIDIGANDSTTLQAFPQENTVLVGVDPTGVKFREFYPDHIRLIPDFFSARRVRAALGDKKRAAVITSFSMFYDLERPLEFVREIRDLLDDEGIWVFEQSYMPTMLMRNSYDTVCHEHLEYYALKQIKWMLDRADMKIVDVTFNDVNGGSFSVTAGPAGSERPESPEVHNILKAETRSGLDTLDPYYAFAHRVAQSRDDLLDFLEQTRKSGSSICGLGASTKGNVLLQYCHITELDIQKIGEVNRCKFGSFTPGTGVPIVSEDEVLSFGTDYLLVLPWHFRGFFQNHSKLAGRNLIFPLPNLEIVRGATARN